MDHFVVIKIFVLYYSADQSNSSVEKAGLLGSIPMRLLPTDDKCRLRGATLEEAIRSDMKRGLIPCYVSIVTSTFKHVIELKDLPNTKKSLKEIFGAISKNQQH